MSEITRRTALAGATVLASAAALPAVSLAEAVPANAVRGDDSELLALVERFFELDREQLALRDAGREVWTQAMRRPGFEHVTTEEIWALRRAAMNLMRDVPEPRQRRARARLVEIGYFGERGLPDGSPEALAADELDEQHRKRADLLWTEAKELEPLIARISATTAAGALAKLRMVDRFITVINKPHRTTLQGLMSDLERMAAGEGRVA